MDMQIFISNRTYVELLRIYTQWLKRLHSIQQIVSSQPDNQKAKRIQDGLLFRLLHINITLESLGKLIELIVGGISYSAMLNFTLHVTIKMYIDL
jgi:hypothetical protein